MSTIARLLQWLAADAHYPRWVFGVCFTVTFIVACVLIGLAWYITSSKGIEDQIRDDDQL